MPTHVLIVDDDPDIRDTLRLVLEDEGYAVQAACDGAMALDLLRRSPYPMVVLTNHNMPRLDGPGLLSFVSQDPSLLQRDAFIYMTAGNRIIAPDVARTLHELRAPVLRKPFDIEQLTQAVTEAASRLHHSPDDGTEGECGSPAV